MESGVVPPSTAELNLLLEWPESRTHAQWAAIFAASVAIHFLIFLVGTRVPRLLGERKEMEARVIRHYTPLYLPRELMTQRAPNRHELSKHIDLADLTQSSPTRPTAGGHSGSVRRFQAPKQARQPQTLVKNEPPQILAQAPVVNASPTGETPSGVAGGLPIPAPPPPSPTAGPFQNIGEAAPPNPHPALVPPKAAINGAPNGLLQSANGRELIISDDVPAASPGSLGATERGPTQHAAVELQSDPSGADFKAYLQNILMIVRSNWRRVVPESARMGMLRGRTIVEFVIDRDGGIPKLVVADPSGSTPLDRAAVAGLSMSNPLPPLPASYRGLQVRLAFTFAYNLPAK